MAPSPRRSGHCARAVEVHVDLRAVVGGEHDADVEGDVAVVVDGEPVGGGLAGHRALHAAVELHRLQLLDDALARRRGAEHEQAVGVGDDGEGAEGLQFHGRGVWHTRSALRPVGDHLDDAVHAVLVVAGEVAGVLDRARARGTRRWSTRGPRRAPTPRPAPGGATPRARSRDGPARRARRRSARGRWVVVHHHEADLGVRAYPDRSRRTARSGCGRSSMVHGHRAGPEHAVATVAAAGAGTCASTTAPAPSSEHHRRDRRRDQPMPCAAPRSRRAPACQRRPPPTTTQRRAHEQHREPPRRAVVGRRRRRRSRPGEPTAACRPGSTPRGRGRAHRPGCDTST